MSTGEVTLQVSNKGNNIYRLRESNADGPDPTPGPVALDDYEWATIEGLFERVENILRDGPLQSGKIDKDWSPFFYDYGIKFDPELGYPREIRRTGRAPAAWRKGNIFFHSSGPAHSSSVISIKALHAIKSSKP
jgi:hypothetical protein